MKRYILLGFFAGVVIFYLITCFVVYSFPADFSEMERSDRTIIAFLWLVCGIIGAIFGTDIKVEEE